MKKSKSAFWGISLAVLVVFLIGLVITLATQKNYDVTFVVDGYEILSTGADKDAVFPNAPKKENEVFVGWYWVSPYGEVQVGNNYFLNNSASEDMRLVAKYEAAKPTAPSEQLVFDRIVYIEDPDISGYEGGSLGYGSSSEEQTDGSSVENPWDFEEEEVLYDSGKAGLTLYVVWLPNTNELVFRYSGGGNVAISESSILSSAAVALLPSILEKKGYVYHKVSGIPSGAVLSGSAGAVHGAAPSDTDGYTVFVDWRPKNNRLIYDANGGTGKMADGAFLSDTPTNLAKNAFVREGYRFVGWANTQDGAAAYLDEASFNIGTEEEATLFAVWELLPCTVLFVGGELATGSMEPAIINANSTFVFPTSTFAKNRYRFQGWQWGGEVKQPGDSAWVGTNQTITAHAVWARRTDAEYTLEVYVENANGNPEYRGQTILTANVGETVFATPTQKEGFFVDEEASVLSGILPDDDYLLVLRVVYRRTTVQVVFEGDGGELVAGESTQRVLFGLDAELPTFYKEGYTFLGFSQNHTNVQRDIVVVANWCWAPCTPTEAQDVWVAPTHTKQTPNLVCEDAHQNSLAELPLVQIIRLATYGGNTTAAALGGTSAYHTERAVELELKKGTGTEVPILWFFIRA